MVDNFIGLVNYKLSRHRMHKFSCYHLDDDKMEQLQFDEITATIVHAR